MKEKEEIKISLSTFFLTLAIIAIIILGYFIFNISKQNTQLSDENSNLNNKLSLIENEKNEAKTETNERNSEDISENSKETENTISTNEKVAIFTLDDTQFYGYIDDGSLYYAIYDGSTEFGNAPEGKINKYEKLANISKISYYNNGTSTAPELILLTEEGKIYTIDVASTLAKKAKTLDNANLLETTKNLNVKDFKLENAKGNLNLNLTLQDGTSKSITLFSYPE